MEKEGTAISLVAHDDFETLDEIKDQTSTQITELKTSIEVKKGPPKKYKAICSKCKAKIELPFKPTQGRPVYCKKCYRSKNRRHRRRH
jgi:CxxC-x17-CxxC domain-containing protein